MERMESIDADTPQSKGNCTTIESLARAEGAATVEVCTDAPVKVENNSPTVASTDAPLHVENTAGVAVAVDVQIKVDNDDPARVKNDVQIKVDNDAGVIRSGTDNCDQE